MTDTKVAIVTGASSGIGASLSGALAREGYQVVLAARRIEKLNQVAESINAAHGNVRVAHCDVTVRSEAEALINDTVRELGRIDILVNNAGRGHLAAVEETTDEVIESMFAVNVYALWYTTRPTLRYMKQQGSGHIINVASMAGKLGYPYNSAYVAAKHACVGFTRALRMELIETGIHATVVCPAGVLTDWASVTEGGPMRPFLSESGPIVKRIAEERGIGLIPMQGVMPPELVAERIMDVIRHPIAECYTHQGSREFVILSATEPEKAEQYQIPVALGERKVYERRKRG